MLDLMKGYLQLAAGLGEMSRRKALGVARELVEGSPVAGMLPGNGVAGADAVTAQVTAVADELMAIGRQNRRLVTQLVRTETHAVLASLGIASDDGATTTGALERQLRALRQRIDELERELRGRAEAAAGVVRRPGSVASWASGAAAASMPRSAAGRGSSTSSRTRKAAPTKSATRGPLAEDAVATKSATKKASTKKATAGGATARSTATKKTASKNMASKKTATKKTASKRLPRTTGPATTGRATGATSRSAGGRGRQQGATS